MPIPEIFVSGMVWVESESVGLAVVSMVMWGDAVVAHNIDWLYCL